MNKNNAVKLNITCNHEAMTHLIQSVFARSYYEIGNICMVVFRLKDELVNVPTSHFDITCTNAQVLVKYKDMVSEISFDTGDTSKDPFEYFATIHTGFITIIRVATKKLAAVELGLSPITYTKSGKKYLSALNIDDIYHTAINKTIHLLRIYGDFKNRFFVQNGKESSPLKTLNDNKEAAVLELFACNDKLIIAEHKRSKFSDIIVSSIHPKNNDQELEFELRERVI